MILVNSAIDYAGILLFVFDFLVYWKIVPNSRAFSCLRQHLAYDMITKQSRQSCQKKQNVTSKKIIFKFLLQ